MSIDTPFGSEDTMTYGYAEPACYDCEDSGMVERGDGRMLPCPSCRPAEHDYVMETGQVEP